MWLCGPTTTKPKPKPVGPSNNLAAWYHASDTAPTNSPYYFVSTRPATTLLLSIYSARSSARISHYPAHGSTPNVVCY
ncbi:hypothetical protein KCU62_g211, partial [Aureobasidium sp. EXF-3399]